MIVRVDHDGTCSLHEEDAFDGLKVELTGFTSPAAVQPSCGLWDQSGAYLWIDARWLRKRPAVAEDWQQRLENMLGYAAGRGWVDQDGRIRAHIVSS